MKITAYVVAALLGVGTFVYHTGFLLDPAAVYAAAHPLNDHAFDDASQWLVERAAHYGHSPAMLHTSDHYRFRHSRYGRAEDSLQAMAWRAKARKVATARRSPEDLLSLALLATYDPWGTSDRDQAMTYLEECLPTGHVPCRMLLARLEWYEGVDRQRGLERMTTLAREGHVSAQRDVASMHLNAWEEPVGAWTPRAHWAEGVAWLRRAAAQGHEGAAQALRSLTYNGLLEGPKGQP